MACGHSYQRPPLIKSKKIAVLGGGGFIGSHITAKLADEGHSVRVADINFPELRREWWARGDRVWVDLRIPGDAAKAIGDAEYVFHFAADMGGVGYFHSDADPKAATANMQIDLNVLKACKAAGVPFFYASSACCLPTTSQTHGDSYTLHEGLLGQGPADQMYGEEKRFMTLLLRGESLARVGIFHTIYGPGQEWDGPRAKFPPAICRKVKQGGKIEIWGDGTQKRSFLYVDDGVEKILAVAFQDEYHGPVNIGSDEEVTVQGCADDLCAHANIMPLYDFRLDKPTGVLARSCDNAEFDRRYGRIASVSASEGLRRLYEWLP